MALLNKDRTIYLHIGLHKTGSTAIQSAFEGYESRSIRYADFGYQNHSIPFYTIYSGHHQTYHIWKAAGLPADKIEARRLQILGDVTNYLSGNLHKDVIISGEDISVIPQPGAAEFFNFISNFGAKVKVISYVRDPMGFIKSNIQEQIKADVFKNQPEAPQYRLRLEKFIDFFGKENVIIRNYERSSLKGQDIVSDFSSIVGCDVPRAPKISNETMSTEAVRIIYLLNKFISAFGEGREMWETRYAFMQRVRDVFPGKFEIPSHLMLKSVNFDDVNWLKSTSGIDYSTVIPTSFADDGWRSLDQFLSTPLASTIEKLKREFIADRQVPKPDAGSALLVARCFMSFLLSNSKKK